MLANKAKLGYSTTESGAATDLPGLKQLPELGAEPTMVDNTCLTDTIITNEMGIGDSGSLEYVFKFVNSAASDSYRILKALDSTTTYYWTQEALRFLLWQSMKRCLPWALPERPVWM